MYLCFIEEDPAAGVDEVVLRELQQIGDVGLIRLHDCAQDAALEGRHQRLDGAWVIYREFDEWNGCRVVAVHGNLRYYFETLNHAMSAILGCDCLQFVTEGR